MRRAPSSAHFPYTTLFRSSGFQKGAYGVEVDRLRPAELQPGRQRSQLLRGDGGVASEPAQQQGTDAGPDGAEIRDRKSTRLNSSHVEISYAAFCVNNIMEA